MVTVFETLLGYILSIDYPKRECESVCVCVCVCAYLLVKSLKQTFSLRWRWVCSDAGMSKKLLAIAYGPWTKRKTCIKKTNKQTKNRHTKKKKTYH